MLGADLDLRTYLCGLETPSEASKTAVRNASTIGKELEDCRLRHQGNLPGERVPLAAEGLLGVRGRGRRSQLNEHEVEAETKNKLRRWSYNSL